LVRDNYHKLGYGMSKTEQPGTMTAALKRAIADSGKTFLDLERATSVKRASIMRFMRGETSLRLDVADKLAVYFGLELRAKRKDR
jgi:plasmid maintenance system antidote protein VapI